ncbi:MAG: hypothetical protein QM778_03485 [Myxococcales bacterium]
MRAHVCQRSLPFVLLTALGCGTGAAAHPQPESAVTASAPAPTQAAAPSSPVSTSSEPWTTVENPRARYIVALALPVAHDDSVRPEHLEHARSHAAQALQSIADLELAPPHFDRPTLLAEGTRRNLPSVFLECGVTLHHVDELGTHFAVNVTVVDLRTEDIVASLGGKATAPGPTSTESEQLALEGALNTALRGVPELLAALEGSLVASGR